MEISGVSLVAQLVKTDCNAGDLGSILGLGRSPREVNSYKIGYSGLENSMDHIVNGIAKGGTCLRHSHFHFLWRFIMGKWLT